MEKRHFRPYIQNQIVLFPERVDKDITEDDPVRFISAIVDGLDLEPFKKLYYTMGRSPYHPKMMLKVIIYAYMNNIYSCREMEKRLLRDTHFIWLAGGEKPDFVTINRFRNRVKREINEIFTQLVLLLAERGLISLDVEYIDGTKIESKANKYTFVWRKNIERYRSNLMEKLRVLLQQVDDVIIQDQQAKPEVVEFTPTELTSIVEELKEALDKEPTPETKEAKAEHRKRKKQIKTLEEHRDKLAEYDQRIDQLGKRNSMSKTDPDATFMRMKEDAKGKGLAKPGYNLQIATENQIITDYALFPNPSDTCTLIPFLESFQERYDHLPTTVVADAGYGSEENYRFMEESEMNAYVKYNYFHQEQRPRYKNNPFLPDHLYYNAQENYYVCPMGQHLEFRETTTTKTSTGYTSESSIYEAKNCRGCPLRSQCYKGKEDRRKISVNHRLNSYKQKARTLLTSEKGIKHRKRRSVEPESVFGQMKNNMHYRRFRHFGQDKVLMDFAFFAIAFNLKKVAAQLKKTQENDPLPSQDATSRGKEGAERFEIITFTHFKPYLSKNVFSIAA